MKPGIIGRAIATIIAPFRSSRATHSRYRELARHIEQRSYIATLDAQAYCDQRIAELGKVPPELGRQIEERSLLASQEAKAYADVAVHSLSMALRGMSHAILRLSRRVEQLETAYADPSADGGPVDALPLRRPENGGIGGDPAALDSDLRVLAADLARLETMFREIEARQAVDSMSGNAGETTSARPS